VNWVSKASAAQRAGRAGRVGPGHCYRLYSSALFENHFPKFSEPEILRMPVEGIVLQMKAMHIDAVINFPFPTPPDRTILQKAQKVLTYLGALKPSMTTGAQITELGRTMALFPLSPRFSRMLVSGQQHGCLPYVITMVSALSVGDPFLHEEAPLNEGEEGSSDKDMSETSHVTSEAVREKEKRRVRFKAFFESQTVRLNLPSRWLLH
jgi:ATP-dependent RNA helicase DHX37/DHR1